MTKKKNSSPKIGKLYTTFLLEGTTQVFKMKASKGIVDAIHHHLFSDIPKDFYIKQEILQPDIP